jgi:hypothetical protein
MQMRAARMGLRIIELPVAHRRRAGGVSKVSGTFSGTLKASWRILLTFARTALEAKPSAAGMASDQVAPSGADPSPQPSPRVHGEREGPARSVGG